MRKKKELTWQQKAYGVVVIILIVWMLIHNMVNGRIQDEAVLNGAVFLMDQVDSFSLPNDRKTLAV